MFTPPFDFWKGAALVRTEAAPPPGALALLGLSPSVSISLARGAEGGRLSPPPIGYPPLPPRAMPRKPSRGAAAGVPAVSPYVGWSATKAYRFPCAHDGHPVVNEILSGKLSGQTRSECGLDEFNYFVRSRPAPARCQAEELKETLRLWAASDPATLLQHLFHESLDQALARDFPWAIFGKVKTLARRRDRKPW